MLCDAVGPVCYDAQGPSIGHTQTYFGRSAAERLTAKLSGRPKVEEFRLGNGALCDTRASQCWADGYNRRQPAPLLTRQLFGTGGSQANASTSGITRPAAGVICDPAAELCYDSQGLSLALTREYHGIYAEQKALRQLGGQPAPKVFRLSNSTVCDVGARRCWSDGWDRRTIDEKLSRHLFGSQNNQGNQAGSLGGFTRQAQCRLTRWFKVLASGSCEISDQSGGRGRRLAVSLGDGSTYTFSNVRGEGYRVSDGKGDSWPVRVSDQGSSLSFAWSDKVLQMTPQRQGGSSKTSLGSLIDSLLGN
ncbi:MAG: YcgJ family protein [Cyanobium sp.]